MLDSRSAIPRSLDIIRRLFQHHAMRLDRIDPGSFAVPSARPVLLQGDKETGVLLLHGFTGYVGRVRYLAERLHHEGYTVSCPRLPGHGSTGSDFQQSSAKDWLRRAVDSYLDLKGLCDGVIVSGLSMGGLLAAALAAHFPVERLMMFAPALKTTNPLLPYTPWLRWFFGSTPKEEKEKVENADEQRLADEYWNWNWPGPAAELLRLQKFARRELRKISCPTLVVASKRDNAVPVSIIELVESQIGSSSLSSVVLEHSAHVVTSDTEKELVADTVIEWLSRSLND